MQKLYAPWVSLGLLSSILAILLKRLQPNYLPLFLAVISIEFLVSLLVVLHMAYSPTLVLPLSGIVMILTWLCFYYWDFIKLKMFPVKKNELIFKQLALDLRHAVDVINEMNSIILNHKIMDAMEPPMMDTIFGRGVEIEDIGKIDQLIHLFKSMDIAPPDAPPFHYLSDEAREIWGEHFSQAVPYAKHRTYKEYVEFLRTQSEFEVELTDDEVPF